VPFAAPPAVAAWRHLDARPGTDVAGIEVAGIEVAGIEVAGIEVAGIEVADGGWLVTGSTAAVEDGGAWVVDYELRLFPDWRTRSARVTRRVGAAATTVEVHTDGHGRWRVDGVLRQELHGCRDVDLESSALTNTFPVHRLALDPGRSAEAPAAYIRSSLAVERLEQTYARVDADEGHQRFRYRAPAFDFSSRIVVDAAGFALDYPPIAVRAL
jgi:hypothetical protein